AIPIVRVMQRRASHPITGEDLALGQRVLAQPQVRLTRPQTGSAGTEVAGAGTQLRLCLCHSDLALWQTAWKWLCPDWRSPQQRPHHPPDNDQPPSVLDLRLHPPSLAPWSVSPLAHT